MISIASGRRAALKFILLLSTVCLFPPCLRLARAQVGPAMAGALQWGTPLTFNAGPLGKLDALGILSGMGLAQSNRVSGDEPTQGDLSNGQIIIQKTTGWWQFYLQAGAYNLPALGVPFLSTADTVSNFYDALPVGYLQLAPRKNLSILIGKLPTLMGAESTFDFENMNIERGLLWGQENAVNRGIQINQTLGKFTASLSWNDGFYSDRYSWLSGSLTYSNGPNSLAFSAMGNLGQTSFRTPATPVQNNGSMYALVYTYTKGSWIVQPYFQYTDVPTNQKIGILHGAATRGGALLATYKFTRHVSIAGRGEYISSTGNVAENGVNLLYGPGSSAWSVTLTPTFIDHGFFVRGEFSLVQARNLTLGDGFGPRGSNSTQTRGLVEGGFML